MDEVEARFLTNFHHKKIIVMKRNVKVGLKRKAKKKGYKSASLISAEMMRNF